MVYGRVFYSFIQGLATRVLYMALSLENKEQGVTTTQGRMLSPPTVIIRHSYRREKSGMFRFK